MSQTNNTKTIDSWISWIIITVKLKKKMQFCFIRLELKQCLMKKIFIIK